MKKVIGSLALSALLLVATIPASAAVVTLQSLYDGGSISVGNWTFSNFQETTNNASGLATPVDPTLVNVEGILALGAARLEFDMGGQTRVVNTTATASLQSYQFLYQAQFSGGNVAQAFQRTTFTSDVANNSSTGGQLTANANVSDVNGLNAIDLNTFLNTRDIPNSEQAQASLPFSGTDQPLNVLTNLGLDIDSGIDFQHEIVSFDQEFNPVPIPAAIWLFGSGLGLVGFLSRRRKKA